MSRSYEVHVIKAAASGSSDVGWYGGADEHVRDCWPAANRRRRCRCGCGGAADWIGGANGVALCGGCEWSMRRWVKHGYEERPHRHAWKWKPHRQRHVCWCGEARRPGAALPIEADA